MGAEKMYPPPKKKKKKPCTQMFDRQGTHKNNTGDRDYVYPPRSSRSARLRGVVRGVVNPYQDPPSVKYKNAT